MSDTDDLNTGVVDNNQEGAEGNGWQSPTTRLVTRSDAPLGCMFAVLAIGLSAIPVAREIRNLMRENQDYPSPQVALAGEGIGAVAQHQFPVLDTPSHLERQ